MRIKKQLLWLNEMIKFNMKSILEYKASFMMQVFGMMVNNSAFILVWYLFFEIFEDVNGWGFKEMIGINGVVAFIYGVVFTFGNGIRKISRNVTYGQLDKYLVMPKSPLLSIIFSDANVSAIGDLIFGVILLVTYFFMSEFGLSELLLLFPLLIFATMIFSGFVIAAQSVVFWIPNSDDLSDTLFEFMLGPSMYPNSAFTGIARFFFTFFIPAIFISGVPINTLLELELLNLVAMGVAAVVWVGLSVLVFNVGLKRYESGNLVGIR